MLPGRIQAHLLGGVPVYIDMLTRAKTVVPALVAITVSLVLSGCFAPRHKWHYWLPDKTVPSVEFAGYRINLDFVDYNLDGGKNLKPVYAVGVGFRTYYLGPVPDTSRMDSIPLISVESVCIQLFNSGRTICPPLLLASRQADELTYYGGEWHGPDFGAEYTVFIPHEDEEIGVSFVVVTRDRVTGVELQRQEFSLELKRFHDRYWILAD